MPQRSQSFLLFRVLPRTRRLQVTFTTRVSPSTGFINPKLALPSLMTFSHLYPQGTGIISVYLHTRFYGGLGQARQKHWNNCATPVVLASRLVSKTFLLGSGGHTLGTLPLVWVAAPAVSKPTPRRVLSFLSSAGNHQVSLVQREVQQPTGHPQPWWFLLPQDSFPHVLTGFS